MNNERLRKILGRVPLHVVVIGLCVLWLIPALGIFVTSFRPRTTVRDSGWWTMLSSRATPGQGEYKSTCASCHGADGKTIAAADLTDPDLAGSYSASNKLVPLLRQEIDGVPHLEASEFQEMLLDKSRTREAMDKVAPIASYLQTLAGLQETSQARFTLDNYTDALVGYKGGRSYQEDCDTGEESTAAKFDCSIVSDMGNPEGMARAFRNSLLVTIPSTLLPILFAAAAAYAFAWIDFRGRQWMFALLVGMQIVPLQMTLIPIAKLYKDLGIQNSFLGVWLFHTGFGLPYAIYLMRNFLGSLPRDLFESIYLDGAGHFTAFWRLALPLSVPAIGSLAIFQFLWVWNDLLVAIILLGGKQPVLTYQITQLIDPKGGNWHLLTAAAFLSMLVPMIIFFSMQRYFVRGLLAGSVKG